MTVPRIVAGNKIVEVGTLERVLFEGEVHVRPQVVDPELRRPRLFVSGGFSVEKEDVCLHALL